MKKLNSIQTLIMCIYLVHSTPALSNSEPLEECVIKDNAVKHTVSEAIEEEVQKALAYNSDGEYGKSLSILTKLKTTVPFERAYIDRSIGYLYVDFEDEADNALNYLKRAVKNEVLGREEHAKTLHLVALISMREEYYKEAVDYYEAWMEYTCDFTDGKVYERVAHAHLMEKNYSGAIESANQAIKYGNRLTKNPYLIKLSAYHENKDFTNAIKVLKDLVAKFPEEPRYWFQLTMFYITVEDYERALAVMEGANDKGFVVEEKHLKLFAQLRDMVYKQ